MPDDSSLTTSAPDCSELSLRRYQQIWHILRETGTCSVKIHPSFARRLRKAVRKEKHMDYRWKMEKEPEAYYVVSKYDPATMTLSFTLKPKGVDV